MTFELHQGDALEVLRGLPAASADALVTDPPAGIGFMGAAWDKDKGGRDAWVAWLAGVLAEARRVLAPSSCALVWALPRTAHWTAMAVEDAGFRVVDVIVHLQAQGFPKSKALLKPAAEHWILARAPGPVRELNIDACRIACGARPLIDARANVLAGDGRFGTMGGSKAAGETTLGRWPANVALSHLPECERAGTKRVRGSHQNGVPWVAKNVGFEGRGGGSTNGGHVGADGLETVEAWRCAPGCAVAALDEQSGVRKSGIAVTRNGGGRRIFGSAPGGETVPDSGYTDTGGASRFFFCSKASRSERGENIGDNPHPTVKPLDLMRWLCRLITPRGGTVLDPFAGSGTTGVAALQEGLRFVGIERAAEYYELARRRIGNALGPLFAGAVGGAL